MLIPIGLGMMFALLLGYERYVRCPSHLRHLPRLPVWPIVKSLLSGETESSRIRRLIVPFADSRGCGLVLVWALGNWYAHIVDPVLARRLMEDKTIEKQLPSRDMLFWQLTGFQGVLLADTASWTTQAPAVREVLRNNTPVALFSVLAQKLFKRMGRGGRVRWSSLTHAFTLDAVGHAIMGHDFDAIANPQDSAVVIYRDVMRATAHPIYVAFPVLERLCPRKDVLAKLDVLVQHFLAIIEEKRATPGNDFISALLSIENLTDTQVRDNAIVMFMAGHDTTAGALSSVVFYLAKHPECQSRARSEVQSVLRDRGDPFSVSMSDLHCMDYVTACVKEAMRMNGPSTTTLPRVSPRTLCLGSYAIPSGTPVFVNMYAIGQSSRVWGDSHAFVPERFLGAQEATSIGTHIKSKASDLWIPFSVGSRRCPAVNFAMTEQRTLLALLLLHYEWMLPEHSIHGGLDGIHNAPSAFALNLPLDVDLDFTPCAPSA